jgi:hypothetical protein
MVQKGKGTTKGGLTIKLAPIQPNTMETRFACLEVLVTSMASSMVARVKPHAYGSGRIKNQENTQSSGSNLGYFCELIFQGHWSQMIY